MTCHTVQRFVERLEGASVATVHKGYRLDVELVERIDAWAEAHGMTQAEAVRKLLTTALEDAGQEGQEDGGREDAGASTATASAETLAMLGEHIRDLRANVSTLTAQVAEKDAQIHRLLDVADHAQALQAAQAQTQLLEAAGAVDAAQGVQQEGTQRQGWRTRLARWIAGR